MLYNSIQTHNQQVFYFAISAYNGLQLTVANRKRCHHLINRARSGQSSNLQQLCSCACTLLAQTVEIIVSEQSAFSLPCKSAFSDGEYSDKMFV